MPRLGFQEGQQVGVELILMGCSEAVRCARIVDFLRALDELGRFLSRILDGNDLVVLTMHDQGWDIELLEVLGEISLREGLDAFVGVLEASLHAPEPELIQDSLGDLGPLPISAVERVWPSPCRIASDPWLGSNASHQTLPSAGPPDWWLTSA